MAKAPECFERYQQLDPSAAGKDKAAIHLNSLEGRRALYDAVVDEAEGVVSELLLSSMGISSEGVQMAELGKCGVKLYETTEETVQDVKLDAATLLRTSADQRQLFEGLDFRVLPSRPREFEYRETL